jgi:hypothetical protein
MKQFILKNIVLVVILALALIGSIVLIFFCNGERRTIGQSMADIQANVEKLQTIDSARKPNSVAESETRIKADTEALSRKNDEIHSYFGKPYRPALLKFLKNIASPAALETELPLDPTLVAEKTETKKPETADSEDGEAVAEAAASAPSEPTEEEKAVFDPKGNKCIISFDESALRAMLADLYRDIHQESSDDTFVIPDTVRSERAQLFKKLFNQIIEAPDAVDPARAQSFREEAAAKFAKAFAIFREEVQALTLEDVTDDVAHELFLDALGLPRLMRQRDCKNYIDFLYEKYLNADIIPGLPSDDPFEREKRVQDFIYGKNLNRQALPVPEMVIPIIRNFQIKEDLFRRMKDTGIGTLRSMTAGVFYGTTMDNDSEGPVLYFTYTLEMVASMDAIDAFINNLHAAYKDGCVYEITDIKFSSSYEDLIAANAIVADHTDSPARRAAAAASQAQAGEEADANAIQPAAAQTVATAARSTYELTDPRHPDYGRTLIGGTRDDITCTIVVNYLFYRADNITPQ